MAQNVFDFGKCKYGLFVHYVHGLALFSDGRKPADIEETVNGFDVEGFADSVASFRVEYLIFTAWHYNAIPLYPSAVTEKWRNRPTPKRDLLGEIIDAVSARGVKVLLYTHPRDGHDFELPDRLATGWGEGHGEAGADKANPSTFNCEKWNAYITELYTELADRYAAKIYGFYTDGSGPYDGYFSAAQNGFQVVDYLAIRAIMKSRNPQLAMIQNYYGYLFSNDYAMPEGYFGYEEKLMEERIEELPAAEKSLALCPFSGGWWPTQKAGADACPVPYENAVKFVLFNSSCSTSGGTLYAVGPYAEGSVWPTGAYGYLSRVGEKLSSYRESVFNATVSRSYPTLSGDTLASLGNRFFMTSADGEYEYLHLTQAADEVILPTAQDGAVLSAPVSLTEGLRVVCFDGEKLLLSGEFDAIDSVIRFKRLNREKAPAFEWLNDTDRRIFYSEGWHHRYLERTEESQKMTLGCFEQDVHLACIENSFLFLAFEGDVLEIYGRGNASVYIDGIFIDAVRSRTENTGKRNLIFTSPKLCGGQHTLYLLAEKDFCLDAVRIAK